MKRIVIAEDDDASRELLEELLSGCGYEVCAARDGQEALRMIEDVQPDLVLLDIQMPVLDGFAVVERLRMDGRFAALPVFAVTANAMLGERDRALASGFTAYITKPVDPDGLLSRVTLGLLESERAKDARSPGGGAGRP